MEKNQSPDFEHEDNEKLARLIAYIPALLHIQNLINLKTSYGIEISKSNEAYIDELESTAGKFYEAGLGNRDLYLPFEIK